MSEKSNPVRLQDTRLKIVSDDMHGRATRVYLNEIDISAMLTDVGVEINCAEVNQIKLALVVGHIDIDVPIGRLDLNAKGIAIHAGSRVGRWLSHAVLWARQNLLSPNAVSEVTRFGDTYHQYIPKR